MKVISLILMMIGGFSLYYAAINVPDMLKNGAKPPYHYLNLLSLLCGVASFYVVLIINIKKSKKKEEDYFFF